jgi:hypothetical protein
LAAVRRKKHGGWAILGDRPDAYYEHRLEKAA